MSYSYWKRYLYGTRSKTVEFTINYAEKIDSNWLKI